MALNFDSDDGLPILFRNHERPTLHVMDDIPVVHLATDESLDSKNCITRVRVKGLFGMFTHTILRLEYVQVKGRNNTHSLFLSVKQTHDGVFC